MSTPAFPLQWPAGQARTKTPATSAYKVKPPAALDELHDSLRLLGATHVVVSSNAPLRRDGRPYAEALSERHADCGVAVYFLLDKERLVIACDCWSRIWENVRAVGLAVEAMRAIQRTGATDLLRRAFTGFRQIGTTERTCWEILGVVPGALPEAIEGAFRRRAMEVHPDRGGTHAQMAELNRARDEALAAGARP